MYASVDGSRVFFASEDSLTEAAVGVSGVKEYVFDTGASTLTYLPGVTPPVLAAPGDGSTFVFENTAESVPEMDMWSSGAISRITQLPVPGATATNQSCQRYPEQKFLCVGPVRIVSGDAAVVFQTDAKIPGFNDGGGFEQVFRYDVAREVLSCVSCPPAGVAPSGDASLSNDDLVGARRPLDSSGVSADGARVFFDSPDALVPQDVNGHRDVYEWEGGQVFLLSSGAGQHDSFFLDNTASGQDVFLATRDALSAGDTDGLYDVYDARVGGVVPPTPPVVCTSECQAPPSAPPVFGPPPSMTFSGPGNLPVAGGSGPVTTVPKKVVKPKKKRKKAKRGRKAGRRARVGAVGGAGSSSGRGFGAGGRGAK
jgi:hypothetical protein